LLQERLSQLSEKMNDLQDDIYQLPCMDEWMKNKKWQLFTTIYFWIIHIYMN
jgi:hypothetical protein